MAEESPTIKEGTQAEATVADATEQTDLDGMISMLEGANITNTDELQNKLTASREVGNLAQQLGAARQEIENLKATKMTPQPKTEYDSYDQQGPVDIESALEGAVEKVLSKREQRQNEIQTQNM
jgi:hypothetical protein